MLNLGEPRNWCNPHSPRACQAFRVCKGNQCGPAREIDRAGGPEQPLRADAQGGTASVKHKRTKGTTNDNFVSSIVFLTFHCCWIQNAYLVLPDPGCMKC